MTIDELVVHVRNQLKKATPPYIPRLAVNRNQTALAAWDEEHSLWYMIVGKGVDGEWYKMPGNLLVNGKPLHAQGDWIEV